MGQEKRKTTSPSAEDENPHKSPRLDAASAVEAPPELGHPPSPEDGESTTGDDSTYDIGSCQHLFSDSEQLGEMARRLKAAARKPPACEHDSCSGAAGMMMACTECPYTFCAGEKGDRENPQGHAAWHAASDQHWVALWCDEPSKGYCFQCGLTLVLGQNKVNEDDYPVVPRTNKDEREMVASYVEDFLARFRRSITVDWEGMLSSVKVDWERVRSDAINRWGVISALDCWEMVAGDDHVIKRMPNLGKTCYMNESLQCLLALGKLRTMILSPDARLGDTGLHLKELFVETSSGNNATHMLDPKMILEDMWSLYPKIFKPNDVCDSHEFLSSLCNALDSEVEQLNKLHIVQGGDDALFPTFGNSIFRCELLQTISCKSCSHDEVTHHAVHGLQLSVPSKDSPARIKPSQVDSTEVKDTIRGCLDTEKNHVPTGAVEVPIKPFDFITMLLGCDFDEMEESTEDSHNTEDMLLGCDFDEMEESTEDSHYTEDKEKAQSSDIVHDLSEHLNSPASIEDCLRLFSHVLTNCKNCSKVAAHLPETNGSKNVEPIMASTNLNTTVDGDQTELSDRETSPRERSSDLRSLSVESPSWQPYRSDSHHLVLLSEGMTSEEITSGKCCGETDLASCSTANEKAESHESVKEASPSCLTTDEQTDLLSAQDIQDNSTQKQDSGKQVVEQQNNQTDGISGATQTQLISKLPPVLTIQLQRYAPDRSKLSERVSFKEILHLGPFMDPSSEDKENSSYRLVGVIEHRGLCLNSGHYIAYVRASRKQQGSGPSSWVFVSDSIIQRVTLEEVRRCDPYILFYERIDD
ncbi:ubiquitin carboxyl-terminal hydrolase 45-like [Lolium rigidum]|uniref:ubiquitin carboxyl-terminal hydrolase 45-like n=1 Tax=Lolium rigidum TaxID=89674 RepID=UPI001F5E0403|nr:ubiquitin carboxyl-terminal hydrolase 45-like [Lolium rigidum]